MKVVHLMRRRGPGMNSVERLFASVRSELDDSSDVTVHAVELPHPSQGIYNLLRNLRFVRRLEADVIHITGDITYCAPAVRSPCVITFLDLVSLQRLTGLKRLVLRTFWYDLPLRKADLVTAISQFTANSLQSEFPKRSVRVEVIHCPLVDGLRPRDSAAVDDGAEFTVMQLGTAPHKNIETTARAVASIDASLRVIGDLSEQQRHTLEVLGVRYSAVAGLDDAALAREFERADVLSFVSTYEGFGMPVIEAQACGVPVVTSTAASLPEIAGDGALFVEPTDAIGLAACFENIRDDAELTDQLVAAGYINVERFRPPMIAEAYARCYLSLGVPQGGT